jgi:hypothetical protein
VNKIDLTKQEKDLETLGIVTITENRGVATGVNLQERGEESDHESVDE